MSASERSVNINWGDVTNKEARGINHADFGGVQSIESDTIVTTKGIVDTDRFYLPRTLVDRFDGHTLWINQK